MNRSYRSDAHLETAVDPPRGVPGKRTLSQQLYLRADRDANGVAAGAESAVDRAAGSSGAPLPEDLRGRFESSLGADLSSVRIHTGSESADASRAVGARAYATGQDIHFGAGQYDPSSAFGVHLIAHEVAHTVQQQGAAPTTQHKLEVSAPQDSAEVEADRAADAMVAGEAARVGCTSGIVRQALQRDPEVIDLDEPELPNEFETDYNMMEHARTAEEASPKDRTTSLVTSRSVNADKAEVGAIIADIDANADAVGRAAEHEQFESCPKQNVTARTSLESMAASLEQTGGALSQFQGAYTASKGDYARVVGMAHGYLSSLGISPSEHTKHAVDHIADGFNAVTEGQKEANAANPRAPKHDAGETLRALPEFEQYEAKRNALETTRGEIGKALNNSNSSGKSLISKIYAIQGNAAAAKAKTKQNELNTLKASCAEAAGWATSILSIAGKVTGLLFVPGSMSGSALLSATDSMEKDLLIPGSFSPSAGGMEFTPGENTGTQRVETAGKIAGAVKQAATGAGFDPAAFMKQAFEMLEADKINKLKSQIDAANEESNLKAALSEAEGLAALKSELKNALQSMQELVTTFQKNKDELKRKSEALSQSALKKGDKTGAVGIRFLTESDAFLAQVDVTLKLGESEQSSGADVRSKREQTGANVLINPDAQQIKYYRGRKVIDDGIFGKKAIYSADRVDIELRRANFGSNEGATGAQNTVGTAMTDLREYQTQVKGLQTSIQNALNIGGPVANTAQTGSR